MKEKRRIVHHNQKRTSTLAFSQPRRLTGTAVMQRAKTVTPAWKAGHTMLEEIEAPSLRPPAVSCESRHGDKTFPFLVMEPIGHDSDHGAPD